MVTIFEVFVMEVNRYVVRHVVLHINFNEKKNFLRDEKYEETRSRYFANKFNYYDYSNNYISGDSNF